MPRAVAALPDAIRHWDDIAARLRGRRLVVFLDFDGTLAPIVERPELARLDAGLRHVIARLAERAWVAIVSGRDRDDVAARVGLEGVIYAGNHGFDIAGPPARPLRHRIGAEFTGALDAAEAELKRRLGDDVTIERKRASIAVHYRRLPEARIPALAATVEAVVAGRPELRLKGGKKVFEIVPRLDWDKGRAVLWLLDALGFERDAAVVIGDDVTDEDAFAAIADKGLGIIVDGASERRSAARYRLEDCAAVGHLLERVTALLATPESSAGAALTARVEPERP